MSEHRVLLAELQQRVDDAVRSLVAPGSEIALLDFPSHSNVGDSAIWLGALATLGRAGVRTIRYTCDYTTYDPRLLAQRLGGGTIVLNGGGNLGDLWDAHQTLRERVIADFPDNPIVQLPQSIHFREEATRIRARAAFDRHPRLTLMVRDDASLAFARTEFKATSVLVPDVAFALGSLVRPAVPTRDVVWLKRADHEDRWGGEAPAQPARNRIDWLDEAPSALIRTHDAAARVAAGRPFLRPALTSALAWMHPRIARTRLERGVRLLGDARVVVTDRLHGHILCMLLGIPHVALDTAQAKMSRFIATWTERSPLVRLAASPDDAARAADSLISARIQDT